MLADGTENALRVCLTYLHQSTFVDIVVQGLEMLLNYVWFLGIP